MRAELGGVRFIRGHSGDTFLPEADVDPGLVQQHGRLFGQQLAAGQPQLEERVLSDGADLGGEHPGRRAPAFAPVFAALEEEHPAARLSQLPGAGSAHRATPNHNDVKGLGHDRAEETF